MVERCSFMTQLLHEINYSKFGRSYASCVVVGVHTVAKQGDDATLDKLRNVALLYHSREALAQYQVIQSFSPSVRGSSSCRRTLWKNSYSVRYLLRCRTPRKILNLVFRCEKWDSMVLVWYTPRAYSPVV